MRFARPKTLALAAALACASAGVLTGVTTAQDGPHPFSTTERAALARGALVVRTQTRRRDGLSLMGGTSWQVVHAPPDVTWRAVLDTNRYTHMLPACVESHVVAHDDVNSVIYVRHVSGPVDTAYYLETHVHAAEHDFTFTLDPRHPHTIRAAWGFFTVRPYGHDESLLSYGVMADLGGGHRVVSTVFVECEQHYRSDGPVELQPVGETEFVERIAAANDKVHPETRIAAGIVAFADLTLGDAVLPVLEAHRRASQRFRGVRHVSAWDASDQVRKSHKHPPRYLLRNSEFRAGVKCLARQGLSFDAWVFHPQIPELAELAAAVPEATIILNHMAGPLGVGPYAADRGQVLRRHGASPAASSGGQVRPRPGSAPGRRC